MMSEFKLTDTEIHLATIEATKRAQWPHPHWNWIKAFAGLIDRSREQRIADLESDVARLHKDKMDLLSQYVFGASPSSAEIVKGLVDARRSMLSRIDEVHAWDRQTGGRTFYDHELEGCTAKIYRTIDAEIARLDLIAAAPTEQK
jgi:hypothetical protein